MMTKKTFPFLFFLVGVLAVWFGMMSVPPCFANDRVKEARTNKIGELKAMFKVAGVSYPPYQVYLQNYKNELELELWARGKDDEKFTLIKTYSVCAASGKLGPKRKQGDYQVPEGVYHINRFNPASSYHLSLGTNYPNKSDRILGDKKRPGGDIFIHGSCVTIGCVPIKDGPIEELYIICLDSKTKYNRPPRAHSFPCRMDQDACQALLDKTSQNKKELSDFWANLKEVHDYFEKNKSLPKITVDKNGKYVINE